MHIIVVLYSIKNGKCAKRYVDGPGEAKVVITSGEQERLKGRGCYFLRNLAPERAVKVT